MAKIVGLKELRGNVEAYISEVKKGNSFIVVKKSRPVFKLSPVEEKDEMWETVADFTRIKKGGVDFKDILKRL